MLFYHIANDEYNSNVPCLKNNSGNNLFSKKKFINCNNIFKNL